MHNITFLLALSATSGCGMLRPKAEVRVVQEYGVPDFLHSPLAVSPVPVGSKDVVASPPAGALESTLLVRLLAEPGAKVFYSFRPFAEDQPETELIEYKEPLLLLPPVTIHAQAQTAAGRGPVRTFAYTFDPKFLKAAAPAEARRLPPVAPAGAKSGLGGAFEAESRFEPLGLLERLKASVEVDGAAKDWSGQGALSALDGLGDVPVPMASTDVAWSQAGETDDAYYFVLALGAKPRAAEGYYYGVDIGASNISLASFGAGASFTYRAEVTKGALTLTRKDKETVLPLSAASRAAVGEVVEIVLAKGDVPLLEGVTDLVVRPYALNAVGGATVLDRQEPLFMRSTFALRRGVIASPTDSRKWTIDFRERASPELASVASLYMQFGSALFPMLESINAIPFYTYGSIPIYFVNKEQNGYAGLNTSDRGLLTTLGPNTSALSKVQILAHEVAHFQNARNSELKSRWLQEGMSEWSAERVLYQSFPPRAVHEFMRTLRFDRYFDKLNGKLDDFPLANWGTESSTSGYEKSLMFMDLLEARIGQEPLRKAFQLAVNAEMDTAGFRRFLEAETGKDLSGLFSYWVEAGEPAANANPYDLFKDEDGDGLLGLDEETLGTDPARLDSDGDGFTDAEEYFRGTDPKVKNGLGPEATDGQAPLRLANDEGVVIRYSLAHGSGNPEVDYTGPAFLRPPYKIAVKLGDETAQIVQRPLFVNGGEVAPNFAADVILPPAALTTETLRSDLVYGSGVVFGDSPLALVDASGDLPASLAPYDLTNVSWTRQNGKFKVTLTTKAKPQPFGEDGAFIVSFDDVTWSPTISPAGRHRFALEMTNGAPYWHVYKVDGGESSAILASGITWTYGDDLQITLDESLIKDWLDEPVDRRVCVRSEVSFAGGGKSFDEAGCFTIAAPGFKRRAASADDFYGLGKHTLEVFINDSAYSQVRADGLLQLGSSALQEFERVLGRPLADRSYWPVHVFYLTSGTTFGAGSLLTGAYLGVPTADEGDRMDYLFVEQLARLATADLLDRHEGVPPYWTQEAFIQWITSSAMYRLYPSKDVHSFHAGRIDDYVCYYDVVTGCGGYFSSDLVLSKWTGETASSTGSVKSLIFTLLLDAELGADVMARVFQTFANGIPNASGFKARLVSEAPAEASLIDQLWTTWVDGTGNASADGAAARRVVDDADADGLYDFEEAKLGTSDAVADSYLD